jgi:site-specific recombinase XerD
MSSMRKAQLKQSGRPTLQVLVGLYLIRCRVEGRSPNTVRAYEETPGRFLRIAEEESFPADVARITPIHLYMYLGRFSQLALQSRHRFFREVRCFFNWLVDAGYLKETPFRSLRNVRVPQKIV